MEAGLLALLPFVIIAVADSGPAVICDSLGRAVIYDYGEGCTVADSGAGWVYTFEYPPVEPGLEFLWAEAVADMEDVRASFESQAESQFMDHEPDRWVSWIVEGRMRVLLVPDGMAVALCEYWWFTGGAHGLNNTFLYRFALDSGSDGASRWVPMGTRDLLADSAELVRLSEIVIDSLERRMGPEPDIDWILRGAGPYWQNYSLLFPVPDSTGSLAGFKVQFPEYGVGPYCFGQQEVFVPIRFLRP